MKEKQAFAQGIGEALQGRIEGLVDMLRDPQATLESYVALLSAIPALPSIIENYVNEFLYELDDEARAAQLGQLLTEAILLLVPGPNLLNLDGISKKLGKAAERVGRGAVQLSSEAEKLARKLNIQVNTKAGQQLLIHLDTKVDTFVAKFRTSSIRRELPGEFLNQTVEQALRSGNPTVRKLLINQRFVK